MASWQLALRCSPTLENYDRSSRPAVAVLDLERCEQEVRSLGDLCHVFQVFDANHAARAEEPIRPEGSLGIHAAERWRVGGNAADAF